MSRKIYMDLTQLCKNRIRILKKTDPASKLDAIRTLAAQLTWGPDPPGTGTGMLTRLYILLLYTKNSKH